MRHGGSGSYVSARRETCSRSSRPGALPAACTVGSCRRHHSPRRGLRPRTELGSPYSPRAMAASVWRARRECVVRLVPLFITPFEPTHPYIAYGLRPRHEHRPVGPCPFQPVGLCVGCAIRWSPLLYHACSLFPPQCALVITPFPGEVDHHSEVVGSVALHRPVRGGAQPRAGMARARRRRAQVDIVEAVERLVAPAS